MRKGTFGLLEDVVEWIGSHTGTSSGAGSGAGTWFSEKGHDLKKSRRWVPPSRDVVVSVPRFS